VRTLTTYDWHTGRLSKPLQIAVLCDLHDEAYGDIWPLIKGADCLLIPGDVVDRYRQTYNRGIAFLNEAASRLPTFFSLGNHEMLIKGREALMEALSRCKAAVLINTYARFGEVWIGGWYRPWLLNMPDMIDQFEQEQGFKLLLCHKPEDYMRGLRDRNVDLVLAGHAHGGQIRIGNQGIYAPGQGLFPKYTKGVVDSRMIVSVGASNPVRMPRWGNPCEVVRVTLE